MSWTLALPLLIPFVGAIAALLAPRLGLRPATIGIVTSGLHLLSAIYLAFAVVDGGVIASGMGARRAAIAPTKGISSGSAKVQL
ncbi:MAG: hypothetical protein AAF675_22045, partial [Pseudomonadota bacterium]